MSKPKKAAPKPITASEILARFDKIENAGVQDALVLLAKEEREQETARMKNVISQINTHLRSKVTAVRNARRLAREADKELEKMNELIANTLKPGATAESIVHTYNVLAGQRIGFVRIKL